MQLFSRRTTLETFYNTVDLNMAIDSLGIVSLYDIMDTYGQLRSG